MYDLVAFSEVLRALPPQTPTSAPNKTWPITKDLAQFDKARRCELYTLVGVQDSGKQLSNRAYEARFALQRRLLSCWTSTRSEWKVLRRRDLRSSPSFLHQPLQLVQVWVDMFEDAKVRRKFFFFFFFFRVPVAQVCHGGGWADVNSKLFL